MKELLLITLLPTILFLIGVLLITSITRQMRIIRLEKRFENFSLTTNKVEELSVFDQIGNAIWKIIHKLGHIFNHSHVLSDYAKKYDRFISFEDKETKENIDYIAIKFLLGFAFIFLSLLAFIIKKIPGNPIILLLSFLIGFFLPDIFLNLKFKHHREKIEEDLLKAIIIMNNSFKSGKSIMQAIETVKTELEGPIADEFKKIYLDITYGLSLEVVFNRFYERVKLEDAKYITSSLTLLNKTGGNIVRVFSSIEKSIFNKKKLNNELKSLTTASIFVYRVLLALPILFSLIIFVLNPTYFNPLFAHPLGILLLLLTILLYGLYIVTIKKVLEVKTK